MPGRAEWTYYALCSFCPDVYWNAADSFTIQNWWPKYVRLVLKCICSYGELLCQFSSIKMWVSNFPWLRWFCSIFYWWFKANTLPNTIYGLGKSKSHLNRWLFISFPLEMWSSTFYIGKFCPGLPGGGVDGWKAMIPLVNPNPLPQTVWIVTTWIETQNNIWNPSCLLTCLSLLQIYFVQSQIVWRAVFSYPLWNLIIFWVGLIRSSRR